MLDDGVLLDDGRIAGVTVSRHANVTSPERSRSGF
jgi:hypothetical protein